MEGSALLVVAAGILAFGLVSGRARRSPLTAPMFFTAFGLAMGSWGLRILDFPIESEWIHVLVELTLVVVLFTDASRIDLRLLVRQHDIPIRLLLLGLPLTVVLGTLAARPLFPELGWWGAALIALCLAPTDAALGHAVVSSPRVPVRIRQALNVESGLNDGIVVPLILLALSGAMMTDEAAGAGMWLRLAGAQLVLGPLVGAAVAYVSGALIQRASENDWMDHTFQDLAAIGVSVLAFTMAEAVGGNGLIAAFTAGLTLGNAFRRVCTCLFEFGEDEGQLLTLLVFTVFGAVIVPAALSTAGSRTLIYAVLSVTVLRMAPVLVSLLGTGLRLPTVWFLGWFGPRGIASITFALMVLSEGPVSGAQTIVSVCRRRCS